MSAPKNIEKKLIPILKNLCQEEGVDAIYLSLSYYLQDNTIKTNKSKRAVSVGINESNL